MAESEIRIQLVTFQLGNEKYGIDIMDVKEIVGIRPIRPIPNVPPYVAGILKIRRMIFPIIDLHKRFHIDKADLSEDDKLLSGFVIINVSHTQIGIIIDKVSRVISIDPASIQPPPQIISGIGAEYIQGVVNENDEYLIILNIKKLFDPNELQQLNKINL
ncbi:MAG: purine-binding chemotaxis protein CheW [Spirochaetales bacterium]|nr:purine-binding chemotaxis protein CheW [Spirochaetales bacterium]